MLPHKSQAQFTGTVWSRHLIVIFTQLQLDTRALGQSLAVRLQNVSITVTIKRSVSAKLSN